MRWCDNGRCTAAAQERRHRVRAAHERGRHAGGRRQVKLAQGEAQSYGGITTVQDYHLIPRQEDVVDSTFMHDNYASHGALPPAPLPLCADAPTASPSRQGRDHGLSQLSFRTMPLDHASGPCPL